MMQVQNARMIERGIRQNWVGGRRYPTRVLKRDLIERVKQQGDYDHVDRFVLANFELLEGDARAKGIAVRNGIAMENANQADELCWRKLAIAAKLGNEQSAQCKQERLNVAINVLKVEEDGNWYGNAGSSRCPNHYHISYRSCWRRPELPVVVCGRRWGKTALGLMATIRGHGPQRGLFKGALDGGKIWWIAPDYITASNVIWPDLKRALKGVWLAKNEIEHRIELPGRRGDHGSAPRTRPRNLSALDWTAL